MPNQTVTTVSSLRLCLRGKAALRSVCRSFRPEEERAGSDVAVISDSLWRAEFGAAPDIIGAKTSINARPFTIVGVMPAGFRFPISVPAAQVWITLAEYARARGG